MRKDLDSGPKPGNDRWSEGRQEGKCFEGRTRRTQPTSVSEMNKQVGENLWQRYRAQLGVWTEKMLETLHEGIKGNKCFSLIDKVIRPDVLELAWEKVRSNAGACGVDGITVERFAKDSQNRLLAVNKHLSEGTYQPKPVKRVWIDKLGSSEKRPLGIPAVIDRIVQTALRMVIEPIFERVFAEHSYGFRPGRSCHDALRRVDKLLKSGHVHVVDIDIKGYFDAIPRQALMERVGEHIADGRVLALIEMFLKQEIKDGELNWEPEKGTPQGGVISPLLANIYLNPLDHLMAKAGMEMVRYADDMIVLCREAEQATQALEVVRQWMEGAGLTLHPQKTRIVAMNEVKNHFDFLGYRLWRGKDGKLKRFVRPKSKKKLKERIKPLTKRSNGWCMAAIIARINPILRGWYGYFRHASRSSMNETDGWVRGRLRSILRKRLKKKGRAKGNDHKRWPNSYFIRLGLFSLEECQNAEKSSLRRGATC